VNVQLAALEIDIGPSEAAQLRGPQAGEDRGEQER